MDKPGESDLTHLLPFWGVCLLSLKRMSGVPSFFSFLFSLKRRSGVPSFLTLPVDEGLALPAFAGFTAGFAAAALVLG